MKRVSDRCIYCEFVAYVEIIMIVIKGTTKGTQWMESPSSVAQEDGVAGKQTSVKIYLSSLCVLYKGLRLFSVYATIVSPDIIRDAFREYIYSVD